MIRHRYHFASAKLPAKVGMITGVGSGIISPHKPIASVDGIHLMIPGVKEKLPLSSHVIRRWGIKYPKRREEWVALFNIALRELQYVDYEEVPKAVIKV